MDLRTFICIGILLACCSAPVLGATKYTGGGPDLSAAIAGTNEFVPGQDATISVVVQNSGLNTYKSVNSGTIERDDLPNTAKLVTVRLFAGTAPVTVRSDPQVAGDLNATRSVTVRFTARISDNATEGAYTLPLQVEYTYLDQSVQGEDTSDSVQFFYRTANQTIPLTIRIKPVVNIEVLEAVPEFLNVGTEGYLDLTIRNTGPEDGKKATVKILQNGASLVIPTDSSVFVGDFPRNGTITCRYKVAVSNNAQKQTYPVDVVVTYENNEGTVITSDPVTVGIPVGGKTVFVVVSDVPQISAGSGGVVAVQYRNTGDAPVYNAQARISAVDPFASIDNTAFLGDLKPGASATAMYDISTDRAAIPGEYALDSEVRYRDALDNSQISDTIRVPVQVGESSGNPYALPLAILLIIIGITGAGYYVLGMRKKK
jgi:hypothetical protein